MATYYVHEKYESNSCSEVSLKKLFWKYREIPGKTPVVEFTTSISYKPLACKFTENELYYRFFSGIFTTFSKHWFCIASLNCYFWYDLFWLIYRTRKVQDHNLKACYRQIQQNRCNYENRSLKASKIFEVVIVLQNF